MEGRELGEKLLHLRKKAALSQTEAAGRLGISRQTLSKWETGKSCPDAVFLKKLSDLYQVSADELLGNEQAFLQEDQTSAREKSLIQPGVWRLLGVLDFLICLALICLSRQMLFWVLNFHCILLGGILLIRILRFLKTK